MVAFPASKLVVALLALPLSVLSLGPGSGPQYVNFWKLAHLRKLNSKRATANTSEFTPQWFRQPLDHFNKETTDTFLQRFWVSTRHYKPGSGGPVVVLDGGETAGTDRLSFLDTGIVDILTRYLGGVGVVLEHRYYGESFVTQNLTTDSLRFLSNAQAFSDSANFMANVKFEGINEDLTAPKTPWIYYGGSYAGARSAIMKVLYPKLVHGAIASSGVTEALIDDWEYYDIIRKSADSLCMSRVESAIQQIDQIIGQGKHTRELKALFGLQNITNDVDFASAISLPLGSWQERNWDPTVGTSDFDTFCSTISQPGNDTVLPERFPVGLAVVNYGKYSRQNIATACPASLTQDQCFGTFNDTAYQTTTLDQTWRLWQFQVCTQWGFYQAAPPDPNYPRIISSLVTVDYLAKICKQAFPPGEHFTVPPQPNVTDVNQFGGYNIAADRLAIIDGQADPWRPCTPHAFQAPPRSDTIIRPFKLIAGAVHHWDENGLANITLEPPEIRAIHEQEVAFVGGWLNKPVNA